MMEGVSNEASSLAGHWGLGKLIAIYDDNKISIDGDTELAFTEDVAARYEALGWHIQHVPEGNTDIEGIRKAIQKAKDVKDKPSFIKVNTAAVILSSRLCFPFDLHTGAPRQAPSFSSIFWLDIPRLRSLSFLYNSFWRK